MTNLFENRLDQVESAFAVSKTKDHKASLCEDYIHF
mgnify:CR=1 FL=1